MKLFILCAIAVTILGSSGCASRDTVYSRGWIGGEFADVGPASTMVGEERLNLPSDISERRDGAVLVKTVLPETPLARGHFKVGDLIVELDRESISDLDELQTLVGRLRPGRNVTARVWRQGEMIDLPLSIGQEYYSIERSLELGFRFKSQMDIVPDRDFSFFIVSWEYNDERLQLQSGEQTRKRRMNSRGEDIGMGSSEGWDIWMGFGGFSARKLILDQRVMPNTANLAMLSGGRSD